jgi:HD domain
MPSMPSTRTVAGVSVPDTPLITSAMNYVRDHTSEILYNHSVRSWLFGCIIAPQIPAFADVDREVHAISVLFHDIGLGGDKAADLVSADKRFEVDGANAAREFLKREASAAEWDKHRLQLVWDSIALHSTVSIALHKEIELQAAVAGIFTDLSGPVGDFGGLVGQEKWDEVTKEYPRMAMKDHAKELLCNICKKKPETTYDNFLRDYAEKYMEGYSVVGKRIIDALENTPA